MKREGGWLKGIKDMSEEKSIVLFDDKKVRRHWNDLKRTLKAEGSEVYEKIVRLKITIRFYFSAGIWQNIGYYEYFSHIL